MSSAGVCRNKVASDAESGSLLELHPRWGRNVVTALARLDGRPVAIVANQPHYLGGVLDAVGSEKAALFVNFCNSFGLPLIAVVDTPGFMPGSRQEQAGVIRTDTLALNLILVPAVFAGVAIGRWLTHRVPQRLFDGLLLGFAVVAALRLVGAW